MNHVAARKVDLQRFGGQLYRARFYGRRSRVNNRDFPGATLEREFVVERKATILKGVAARLCAPPALISARVRNKVQSGPTARGHKKNAGQWESLSSSDIGVHMPSPFDDH